jgi:hypothetical protein
MSDLSRRATAPAARGTFPGPFRSIKTQFKLEKKGGLAALRTVRVFRRVTLWQRHGDAPMRFIG